MDIAYKQPGDFIVSIGSLNGGLGGSEYLKTIHKRIEGPIANIDMRLEHRVQSMCLESIELGIILQRGNTNMERRKVKISSGKSLPSI